MTDKRSARSRVTGCSPVLFPDSPRLSDLAGMPELRAWGEAFARDMFAFREGNIRWSDVDPGLVIHGPPGTGKTTFAQALAASCSVPLIAASYARWQRSGDGHLGNVLSAMESDFLAAEAHAPCILAIDEFDSLPTRASGSDRQEWWNSVINALLERLSGVIARPGVAVIGICNDVSRLDPALLRAGRLDRVIHVSLPDPQQLPDIIRFHLKASEAAGLGDLSRFAASCYGMTGADLGKLVRDARRKARGLGRALSTDDILAVLEPTKRAPDDDRRVAVHEAGHAVAAVRLGASTGIHVSIMERPGVGGRTIIGETHKVLTYEAVRKSLIITLSGRAAEEVILGSVSGGAGGGPTSDLGNATRLAINAIANLGLGETPSLVWYGASADDVLVLRYQEPLSKQVEALLASVYAEARALIERDELVVNKLADALIVRRALAEQDILTLVSQPHLLAEDQAMAQK